MLRSFSIMPGPSGSYERAIPLPDEVDSATAKATYKHGVLRVE
jgi:HSP20 family molecular chaperone IbpA